MSRRDATRRKGRSRGLRFAALAQRHLPKRGPVPSKSPERRIEIELRDLDCYRQTFTFEVRPGVLMSKLDCVLRVRSRHPIPDDALVLFYRHGRELRPGSVVRDREPVFYRVIAGDQDISLHLRWLCDDAAGVLGVAFEDRLMRDIESGFTVADTRQRVAGQLGLADPSRIVIAAADGMRPGPLEGDFWEVRQVRDWLCRRLTVEVYPDGHYLTVRGLGRPYIYHPKTAEDPCAVVRYVKSWVHTRIVKGVHRRCASSLGLRTRQIRLSRDDGAALEGFSAIAWGSVVDFTVPADVTEAFADDETWLLSPTETCAVCCESRAVTEVPHRITAACDHPPAACKQCLQQWLQSSLGELGWDRLKCPECPALLEYDDVRRFAARDSFARYDELAARAALEEMRNFRWCLGADCRSGQIHGADCPRFKCHACRAKHCVVHNVPWHSGETCAEYDVRNRRRRKDEKRSEKTVKDISKQCPECKKDVYKYSGCNHITCVCGHEWCYICFAPYRTTAAGFLRCQHNTGCTERDIFADLGFIPGGMGVGGPRPPPPIPRGFRPPFPHRPPFQAPGGVPWPPRPGARRPGQPVPPAAPVPPLFAAPPHVLQEEMEHVRRRLNAFMGGFPPMAAGAAANPNAARRDIRDVANLLANMEI